MIPHKYLIGKDSSENIIQLSTYPTYGSSGYFASNSEIIIKYSKTGINEKRRSSRDSFQKENPELIFKEISKNEFENLSIFYQRLRDLVKGIIEVSDDPSLTKSKTLFINKANKLELIKLLPADKYEYIDFTSNTEEHFKIAFSESKYLSIEEFTLINSDIYDLVKYTLERALSDIYNLLEAIFNSKP